MMNTLKKNKVAVIAVVVILISLLFMWRRSISKSNKPMIEEEVTVVPDMPVTGYSIKDKQSKYSFDDSWLPSGNTDLESVALDLQGDVASDAEVIQTDEPDIISAGAKAIAGESKEAYTSFAPSRWRGEIL